VAEKLEWFPLYASRFTTDALVIPMSYEAEGIFNALLRHEWINGTVPRELRRALSKPFTAEALAMVEACFEAHRSDPSVRFNKRLEEIRVEQEGRFKAAAVSGRKGGIASGLSRRRLASSNDEASLKRASSTRVSISSSSSSSSTKASNHTETEEQPQSPGTALVHVGELAGQQAVRDKTTARKLKESALALAAKVIFTYWRDCMGFDAKTTVFNDKRRDRIIARLRENQGDVSELLYAIDGAVRDEWTMGRANNSPRPYNGVAQVFRDREKVEQYLQTVKRRTPRHPYLNGNSDDHHSP